MRLEMVDSFQRSHHLQKIWAQSPDFIIVSESSFWFPSDNNNGGPSDNFKVKAPRWRKRRLKRRRSVIPYGCKPDTAAQPQAGQQALLKGGPSWAQYMWQQRQSVSVLCWFQDGDRWPNPLLCPRRPHPYRSHCNHFPISLSFRSNFPTQFFCQHDPTNNLAQSWHLLWQKYKSAGSWNQHKTLKNCLWWSHLLRSPWSNCCGVPLSL